MRIIFLAKLIVNGVLLFFLSFPAEANDEKWNDIWSGVENSFSLPFDEWCNNSNKHSSYDYIVSKWSADMSMSFVKNGNKYTPVLNTDLKFAPLGNWFAEAAFFRYLDKDKQKSWNPDFVYRFGYEDWHPYTFSLVYSNYSGNRSYSDLREKYDKGTYSLSWHYPIPELIAQPFLIEPERTINCTLAALYTPTYIDNNGETRQDQSRLKVTFNAPVYGGWYLSFSMLHYLDSSKQQSWDPDYTFEAGWRGENFSVAYKNYSGTRFPWRTDEPHDGGVAEGSIGITWSWNWLK